jgi:peptide/nickel transport system ATP-binding protein
MIYEALSLPASIRRQERSLEARAILERVGLGAAALARYPHQFSGGQRQRIALARALAVGADVLILDEVTSSLDVSVQATILNLLRDLQQELRLLCVVISHDLSVIRFTSDIVAVMYLGRIVETAPTEALFNSPQHPYTRALIDSVPQFGRPRVKGSIAGDVPDPMAPPEGCRFHTRCPVGPLAVPSRIICQAEDPQRIVAVKAHRAACHFAEIVAEPDVAAGRPMVAPTGATGVGR